MKFTAADMDTYDPYELLTAEERERFIDLANERLADISDDDPDEYVWTVLADVAFEVCS